MPALAWIALVVGLVALGFSLHAASLASRSAPENLRVLVAALRNEVITLGQTSEGRDGKMVAWRAELEAVMEGVEATLESVERKRKQTAASASRLGQNGQPEQPTDWHQVARDRGLL